MENIIRPVNLLLLQKELTQQTFLRKANRGGNELYVTDAHSAPNIMREIGRLREIAFRKCGGGTGKSADIDEFDLMDNPYKQLVVWNPQEHCILGGYRFQYGKGTKVDKQEQPSLATSHLFHFSQKFIKDYLPQTIELGRSFVCVEHQATKDVRKSIYVLDNLWDGLFTLMAQDTSLKYFFGKVTMYQNYNRNARSTILHFLRKMFPDTDNLIQSKCPVEIDIDSRKMDELFWYDNLKDNVRALNNEIRSFGVNIPPLFNAYMNLTPRMRSFGTAINSGFGNVEETAILIAEQDITEDKKKRHLELIS